MSNRTQTIVGCLAVVFCCWQVIPGGDPLSWTQAVGKGAPAAVRNGVAVVCLPLMLVHGLSFMIGSGTLGLMAWRWYGQSPVRDSVLAPLSLPLLSVILVGGQALPFLVVPAGASIRPMAWAAYVVVAAIALTAFSAVRSYAALKRGGNPVVCAAALILSLFIAVVPSLALRAVAGIKGFKLGP